jgi:predicted DNA-binding protein with PD1-like motif
MLIVGVGLPFCLLLLFLAFFHQLPIADHHADHLLGPALRLFSECAHDGLLLGTTSGTQVVSPARLHGLRNDAWNRRLMGITVPGVAAFDGTKRTKSQLVSDTADAQVHVVILDSGEESFSVLTKFANDAKLSAASLTAIGAFEKATVGWFDFASKSYKKIEIGEQCEVLSAIGDVAVGDDGKASLHVHIVLGLPDGSTRGGHLLAGTVRPTLEVMLTEVPSKLRRRKRAALGIALIDIGAS